MTGTKIILTLLAIIAFCYWVRVVWKKRPFNFQKLIVLVFNLLGGIKGVSSFIDAFRMADGSSEHVVWSGMGGFCLALLFFDQVRFSLRVNLSAK